VLGFLYKQRGAVESPEVDLRRPVRTSLALFRSPAYTLGIVIAMAGWGLHVAALSLAPISLVQSVIAGGLVLLTVTADRLFAHEVTRREWIGVALAALGLAFLAATLEGAGGEAHSDYETSRLVAYLAIVCVAATVAAFVAVGSAREGVVLGAAAGMFWAASDTSIKALSGDLGDLSWASIVFSPLAVLIALASAVGLVLSARSLQVGKAVPVIALTSVAANALTIAAGPLVFAEPFPDQPLAVAARLAAFALVIAAAALTPAPVAATRADDVPAPEGSRSLS
jgi:hypothetical protein